MSEEHTEGNANAAGEFKSAARRTGALAIVGAIGFLLGFVVGRLS